MKSHGLCLYSVTLLMQELKDVLSYVPEITELVGLEDSNKLRDVNEEDKDEGAKLVLQSIFSKLMSADNDKISELVLKLKSRLNEESKVLFKCF